MVNTDNLKLLLNTSNFRQATTIAFICLLVALASIILCNHLLEIVMRSHVREMILADVRSQQLNGRLQKTEQVLAALAYRDPFETRKDRHALLFDSNDNVVFGDASLLLQRHCKELCNNNWRHTQVIDAHGNESEILGLLVPLADGGHYFSAYDLHPMLERTRIIPLLTGAGLLLILLFILLTSLPFSMRNMYRINRIRHALALYAKGDHSVTVPHDEYGDEFDQLGSDVNLCLQRINRLMDEVRNVTSHIAHELRTPLTRLQSRLQNATEGVDGDIRAELLQAVKESERIQNLFRAVMRVGEVETGRCAHDFENIQAHELLIDVRDYYLPLAEELGCPLLIDTDSRCWLYGDRALLFQAMANLVDNALKYAPRGLPITLFASHHQDWSHLGVADCGPGIPAQMNDKAMERFQRLDTSGNVPGNGLGLTLSKAICDLHGGSLKLLDNNPGLRATIKIKARQELR
ncbi:hypothetical protein AUC61_19895 [Pseudomonas sp. S25]|uniref:histidine kinase n=1 Tax=Pseudomonas maioricensis TaxID=1766623 RepID=A0ABS9ZMK5_9PSED|nr:HAMP domain-containing sensor histidine kinase [Pseudomonas sp. S25]MCI8211800.1 hypothetical protein [Pseudomonas sp. S25]